MQAASRASITRHLCSFICKAKVFINRTPPPALTLKKVPGGTEPRVGAAGGSGAGGPRWGCGHRDRPEGLRRCFAGSCRVKVSLFSAKSGCGTAVTPQRHACAAASGLQGRRGKASWKGPRPMVRSALGVSLREPQELGYIFVPFRKLCEPGIYF